MKIFIACLFKGNQEQSFFLQALFFCGISRASSKNFNVYTCEHMILGQLRMGARQTKNAAKFLTKRIYEIWGGGVGNGTISFVLPSIWAVSFLAWVVSSRLVRFFQLVRIFLVAAYLSPFFLPRQGRLPGIPGNHRRHPQESTMYNCTYIQKQTAQEL